MVERGMNMACYGCKYLIEDESVNACDCKKCDELTEQQFEKYFINDDDGCPLYVEEFYDDEDAYFDMLSNMPCDNSGICGGMSCPNYFKCQGVK